MPKHEIETVETSFYDREPPYVEGGSTSKWWSLMWTPKSSGYLRGPPNKPAWRCLAQKVPVSWTVTLNDSDVFLIVFCALTKITCCERNLSTLNCSTLFVHSLFLSHQSHLQHVPLFLSLLWCSHSACAAHKWNSFVTTLQLYFEIVRAQDQPVSIGCFSIANQLCKPSRFPKV